MRSANPVVYVVDDDASVREALANLIGSVALRVQCFASSEEFIDRDRTESPSCLVLDVRMPGLSGLDLQRALARADRQIPIIFITAHGDIPMAVQAMREGAIAFFPKPFREEDLLDAIKRALHQDEIAQARRTEIAAIRKRFAQLTPRERQIMSRIAAGRLSKQIAAEFGLSENTVKVHRHRIMEKMHASSLAELLHMIQRLG